MVWSGADQCSRVSRLRGVYPSPRSVPSPPVGTSDRGPLARRAVFGSGFVIFPVLIVTIVVFALEMAYALQCWRAAKTMEILPVFVKPVGSGQPIPQPQRGWAAGSKAEITSLSTFSRAAGSKTEVKSSSTIGQPSVVPTL